MTSDSQAMAAMAAWGLPVQQNHLHQGSDLEFVDRVRQDYKPAARAGPLGV